MIFNICLYVLTAVSVILAGIFLAQRRHLDTGGSKRLAVLYALLLTVAPTLTVIGVVNSGFRPYFFYVSLAIVAVCFIVYRKKIFIFRFTCCSCGRRLSFPAFFFHDDNRCGHCRLSEVGSVDEIDWENLKFTEEAVLCFIRNEGKVLLIHKKTGFGKGKINAPGGRIEQGETAAQAAVRECTEEVGLTPKAVVPAGTLHFYFRDGYSLKGFVFTAAEFKGDLTETEEAAPFWCAETEIPFDRMWEDDIHWVPKLLKGESFDGYFLLEKDTLLDYRLK